MDYNSLKNEIDKFRNGTLSKFSNEDKKTYIKNIKILYLNILTKDTKVTIRYRKSKYEAKLLYDVKEVDINIKILKDNVEKKVDMINIMYIEGEDELNIEENNEENNGEDSETIVGETIVDESENISDNSNNVEVSKNIDTNKRCKTPLRYPGGKSKAIYTLEKHLPNMNNITEFHDCFLGGGSFPIYLTKLYPNLKIKVNDVYYPLYNFWIQLRDNGIKMVDKLIEIKNKNNNPELARALFTKQKEVLENINNNSLDRGVAFYIINKCGFSGLVSSTFSAMASESNFSIKGIENLKIYHNLIKNWVITNHDYREFIHDKDINSNRKEVLIYMDPPYMIGPNNNLYGDHGNLHKVFKHEDFFDICKTIPNCNQMISYNSHNLIKDAFTGYDISDFPLTYTMRSTGNYMEQQKDRLEMVMKHYL